MYAWIAIAVVLLFCVLYAKSRVNISVEPFGQGSNPKEMNEKLAKVITDLKDSVNVVTYKSDLEDLLINFDAWAGHNMINVLAADKMLEPIEKSIEQVREFNDLCEFKRNLNLAMTFVDKA